MRLQAITTGIMTAGIRRGVLWVLQCLLGLAIVVLSTQAQALGLGQIKVRSALNEPLNAEIDVISITKRERRTLKVGLATRADFLTAGIERPFYLTNIKFTIAKRLNGRYFIQLRTHETVREPFIHLLVRLEWAGGQLNREYSALIDPPYLAAGKPAKIETPKVAAPEIATVRTEVRETVPVTTDEERAVILPGATSVKTEKIPEEKPTTEKIVRDDTEETRTDSSGTTTVAREEVSGYSADVEAAPSEFRTDSMGWPIDDGKRAAADDYVAPRIEKLDTGEKPVKRTRGTAVVVTGWSTQARYKVRRGDMMWNIAKRIRVDKRYSLEQVTLAIYQANRQAFFNNNVNNLWAGKILTIPDEEAVAQIARKQARQRFFAQYSVWQEHKLRLAQTKKTIKVADAPAVRFEKKEVTPKPKGDQKATAKTTASAKKTMKPAAKPKTKKKMVAKKKPQLKKTEQPKPTKTAVAEKKPAVTKSVAKKAETPKTTTSVMAQRQPPKSLLRIVRSTLNEEARSASGGKETATVAKSTEDKERAALVAKADTIDEGLDAASMRNKEIKARSAEIKKNIKKQERLIKIENPDLAKAQAKNQTKIAPADKDSKAAVTKTAPESKTKVTKAEPKPAAKAKPVVKKKPLVKKRRQIQPKPAAVQEKNIFQTVLDDLLANTFMLYIVGGVLLVFLLLTAMYIMRRRHSIAEFQESILNTGEPTSDSAQIDSEGQAISTSDTSFLSDFSQGGMGNIHTDEVDPVAEAEVYLAYGRDEQAEEILKEAVVKDPSRHELRVKLLEIYHQRNDVSAFETLAEELYAALEGRAGPPWDKVEEMGRKLNPENPMFRGGAPKPSTATAELHKPETDAGSLFADDAGIGAAVPLMGDTQTETDVLAPDKDFPATDVVSTTDAEDVVGDVDFDLNLDTGGGSAATEDSGLEFESPAAATTEDESSLELDISVDKAPAEAEPSVDISEIDFSVKTEISAAPEDTDVSLSMENDEASLEWDVNSEVAGDETSIAMDGGGDLVLEEAPAEAASGEDSQIQQWDETATKLDLAKAYIDMGDAEGARSILDEVMAEGNESQKSQAAELAKQIA